MNVEDSSRVSSASYLKPAVWPTLSLVTGPPVEVHPSGTGPGHWLNLGFLVKPESLTRSVSVFSKSTSRRTTFSFCSFTYNFTLHRPNLRPKRGPIDSHEPVQRNGELGIKGVDIPHLDVTVWLSVGYPADISFPVYVQLMGNVLYNPGF